MMTPHDMPGDEELLSRRLLAQMLGVVIVSSMFVLALYLVGIIGDARGENATSTATVVEQLPPPVTSGAPPSDDAESSSTPTATTDTATTPSGTGGTQPDPSPATTELPVVPPRIVDVSASGVRADSTDSCGQATAYHPLFAFDDVRETAWMVDGDGVGAVMTIELDEPSAISEVGLVPGYDKIDPCTGSDRFDELRRVTAVRWTFDDGTSIDQEVSPTRGLQTTSIGIPLGASRITMTIMSTTEPGVERLDHTAVSEIVVS